MTKDTKALATAIVSGALIVAIGLIAAAGIDAYNSPYQNCLRAYEGATDFQGDPVDIEQSCVMRVYYNR